VVGLKGLRYAVAQEPQKGDCINDGIIKQLTSGLDTIEARGLYMAQMEVFYPQFELVLCTNYLMEIKSNDHGTWRRIRVVPFKALFTDNPVHDDPDKPYQFLIDRTLEERLSGWKEVFASMLVDIAYETQGKVRDCDEVMEASNSYRQSQDTIAEFIADQLVVDNNPNSKIPPAVITQHFKTWYENNYDRKGRPTNKELIAYMDKKFKNKVGKEWCGVRIVFDKMTSEEIDDDDIPDYAATL
jgi:phage/plasmid-associated DNA primase